MATSTTHQQGMRRSAAIRDTSTDALASPRPSARYAVGAYFNEYNASTDTAFPVTGSTSGKRGGSLFCSLESDDPNDRFWPISASRHRQLWVEKLSFGMAVFGPASVVRVIANHLYGRPPITQSHEGVNRRLA
jgi:hypothetical protein